MGIITHVFIFLFSSSSADVDNNGFLDDKDFECMAVRAAVIEGKGAIKQDRMDHYKNLMTTLWQEISDIADEDRVSRV